MRTRLMTWRLKTRVVLATMALITLVVGLTGGLFVYMLRETMIAQIGKNALDVARSVARIPEIQRALATGDPEGEIQVIAEEIRRAIDADFIVVGDQVGRRYSHPRPDRIGKFMVGGDNAGVLEHGQEYVSVATGTLGPSMRGKVPVLNEDDEVVGVVSVGFLLTEVNQAVWHYSLQVGWVLLIGLGVGVPGAWALAGSIKRAIHGLEPEEIASLAQQQEAILQAIREGIIAVDAEGSVIVANETAQELVPGLRPGVRLLDVLPHSRLPEVLVSGQAEFDHQMLMADRMVVTNRIPIRSGGKVTGAVASFRDRQELERLTQALTDTGRYTEELRAQAHEFANTLQVISGLLQLDRVNDAVDYIQDVTGEYRELIEALPKTIAEPAIAALVLGKRARAEELHCQLTLEPGSYLSSGVVDPSLMVRVVGNLLDNALEAVQARPVEQREVRLRLCETDGWVRVEVADTGPGVPPEHTASIFTEGFSTKAPGRGIGLALVKRLVTGAGGEITLEQPPGGGALFRVSIPRAAEV